MTRKINLRSIATTIPDDSFISKIENFIGQVKNAILEVTFTNMKVYEIENTMFVSLKIKDSSGEMPAMIVGERDKKFQSIIASINTWDTFRIRGNVTLLEDKLPFMNDIKDDKLFCILALDRLGDDKLYGVPVTELYNYDLPLAFAFVNHNTDYLKKYPFKSIKKILFSTYKDIIILLQDGVVLFNGQKILDNINMLIFMSGVSIFAISNNNVITPITGHYASINFINNDNYEYKKIIITPLLIMALTYEGTVKIFGTLIDEPIDYSRLVEVDEIGYVAEGDDLVVIKKDGVYSLLCQHDYFNESPNIMLDGFKGDVTIIS